MLEHSSTKTLNHYLRLGTTGLVLLLTLPGSIYLFIDSYRTNQAQIEALANHALVERQTFLRYANNDIQQYITFTQSQTDDILKKEVKQQVDQAYDLAMALYEREHITRTKEQTQHTVKETLRQIRFFDGRGYIYLNDMQGNSVLQPIKPQLEGQNLLGIKADNGPGAMELIIKALEEKPNAFVQYQWFSPKSPIQLEPKIAYVRTFEPYNWIIGSGDYLYKIENDLKQQVLKWLDAHRLGKSGYIAVIDNNGIIVSHPSRPDLVGTPANNTTNNLIDSEGRPTRFTLIEEPTFVSYQWQHPVKPGQHPKYALVEKLPDWGWTLISSIYPEDKEWSVIEQQRQLKTAFIKSSFTLAVFLISLILVALSIGFMVSRWMNKKVASYQNSLRLQNTKLRRAAQVFESVHEGISISDSEKNIISINRAFTSITGLTEQGILNKPMQYMKMDKETLFQPVDLLQKSETEAWQGEVYIRTPTQKTLPLYLSISKYYKDDEIQFVSIITDISEQKQTQDRLNELANHDNLTLLANRRYFCEQVQSYSLIPAANNHHVAIIYLDIDRFKEINDSYGHHFGDEVILQVSQILRKTIADKGIVSRFGGDEFVSAVFFPKDDDEDLQQILNQLQHQFSRYLTINKHSISLSVSIGIAVTPLKNYQFEPVLLEADLALHSAKKSGSNRIRFFHEEMRALASQKLRMEEDIRTALNNHEFQLYYQPQISLIEQKIIGCEALIRWIKPDGTFIPPDKFIPIAEQSDLINQIGHWVIKQATQQALQWHKQDISIKIAINVSAEQFSHNLTQHIEELLSQHALLPQWLELEITESAVMTNPDDTINKLNYLKKLGFSIALDDFGTGYSSLAYLKQFPIDKLKIDRSFIDGLPEDKNDIALTNSILDIARNLKIKTLAEGVENLEQQAYLTQLGCEEVQGYFYSRPIPEHEFTLWLNDFTRKSRKTKSDENTTFH